MTWSSAVAYVSEPGDDVAKVPAPSRSHAKVRPAAASVPRAMSRWDLPVPESPIRQSGNPFLTQSLVARGWMTAGSTMGLASQVVGPQRLLPRESGSLDAAFGSAAGAVVALGHQQLSQETAVGHPVPGCGVGHVGALDADGGQTQHAAGLVDGSASGLLGRATVTVNSHWFVPSSVWSSDAAAGQQLVVGVDRGRRAAVRRHVVPVLRPGDPAQRRDGLLNGGPSHSRLTGSFLEAFQPVDRALRLEQ